MTASTMTLDLKPNPELTSQTKDLISLAEFYVVTTPEESVEASEFLTRIQKLRRWIGGIYKDAKAPLATAKRTLDAQQKLLLEPLAAAEKQVMERIVSFTAEQERLHAQREAVARLEAENIARAEQVRQAERIRLVAEADATPASSVIALNDQADAIEQSAPLVMPVPVEKEATLSANMHRRITYSAKVDNLSDLILSIAAQIIVSEYKIDESTRTFLTDRFSPTPQCSVSLVSAAMPALNTLARALKKDLNVPGVSLEKKPSLVGK
tara:strand:- start:2598 stop:3398 length:801 start_codon:yes stop_codon:yes gene_type:complete